MSAQRSAVVISLRVPDHGRSSLEDDENSQNSIIISSTRKSEHYGRPTVQPTHIVILIENDCWTLLKLFRERWYDEWNYVKISCGYNFQVCLIKIGYMLPTSPNSKNSPLPFMGRGGVKYLLFLDILFAISLFSQELLSDLVTKRYL